MQKINQKIDVDKLLTRCNNRYNKWKSRGKCEENFANHSLVQLYGYDIYRAMYCVVVYKNNMLIGRQMLTRMIEKDKQKSFLNIERWFEELNEYKHIFNEELNAEEILVLLVEEMGMAQTYHIFEGVLSKNICEGLKIGKHYTDRTCIVCECDDDIIDSMYNAFKINEGMLNREQVKEALAYKFTRSNGYAKVNNATLHCMGHIILTMLMDKYIIELYLVEMDDFIRMRNLLVDVNKMYSKVKLVMQDFLDLALERGFINFGKNVHVNDAICMCTTIYIFKGIVALIFLNCVFDISNDLDLRLMRFVKYYVNTLLDPLEYNEKECQRFMCYFAVTNGVILKAVLDKTTIDSDYKMIYDVSIKGQNGVKKENIKLKANSKKDIYGKILVELNKRRKKEWLLLNELNIYQSVVGDATNCKVFMGEKEKRDAKGESVIKKKNCPGRVVRIEVAEAMEKEYKLKEELKRKAQSNKANDTKGGHFVNVTGHIRLNPLSSKRRGPMYDFNKGENVLHVLKGKSVCARKNHDITNVTGSLVSIRRKTVTLNVSYCKNCQRFFIYADDFVKYTDLNGPLMGHLSFSDINRNKIGIMNFAEESPLHMCGYNVNQQKKYTDDERHTILANIMNYDIMKKQEIIDYLHFYINNLGRKRNMRVAVSKWRKDLDFVNKYKITKQKKVKIHRVTTG